MGMLWLASTQSFQSGRLISKAAQKCKERKDVFFKFKKKTYQGQTHCSSLLAAPYMLFNTRTMHPFGRLYVHALIHNDTPSPQWWRRGYCFQRALTPGIRKYNGDIAKAGEVHRLARGMLECDVEMPDVGVVTVAVTHLVSLDQLARQLSNSAAASGAEQSWVDWNGHGDGIATAAAVNVDAAAAVGVQAWLSFNAVLLPSLSRLMLSYCLPYLV